MFATGSALFGDAQYATARPSTTNGTDPARSASDRRIHAVAESEAGVVATTTTTTMPTDASVNTSAATTRPAIRATGGAGSVRSHACQGVTRSIAPETPNWKNPTPSTAKAAYDASRMSGW